MQRTQIDGIACFGKLRDSSNIEILFDDEELDFVWMTREPDKLKDWQSIIDLFKEYAMQHSTTLVELCSDDE